MLHNIWTKGSLLNSNYSSLKPNIANLYSRGMTKLPSINLACIKDIWSSYMPKHTVTRIIPSKQQLYKIAVWSINHICAITKNQKAQMEMQNIYSKLTNCHIILRISSCPASVVFNQCHHFDGYNIWACVPFSALSSSAFLSTSFRVYKSFDNDIPS